MINLLHHRLLQRLQIRRVLRRRTSHHIVVIIIIPTQRSKLLRIRELDIHPILLHDALDTAPANANDALVVPLWNVERDLGRQFLLEQAQALQDGRIRPGNVDEEVVVVERLKLDLDIRRLHDLVDLSVLLAADKVSVFI